MKRAIILSHVLLALLSTGCMETRYITEKYIKTNIENHKEKQFSTIKTNTIFKGKSSSSKSYLELTGYKYGDNKALVLGADKYYVARKKFDGDRTVIANVTYIELSVDQCQDIITNYKILQEKISAEKPKKNEEVYYDFTVTNDLFISYKKSRGNTTLMYIDFWIKGEKYQISSRKIVRKMVDFLNY